MSHSPITYTYRTPVSLRTPTVHLENVVIAPASELASLATWK